MMKKPELIKMYCVKKIIARFVKSQMNSEYAELLEK